MLTSRNILLSALVLAAGLVVGWLLVAAPARGGAAGIVASYRFDEGHGAAAADHTGHSHGVTLHATKWRSGRYGRALAFNGRSSVANIVRAADLDGPRGVTLEAWVRPTSHGSRTQTIMAKAASGGALAYGLRLRGRRLGGLVRVGKKTARVESRRVVRVGHWQFVALSYDGSTLRIYRNGKRLRKARARGAIRHSVNRLSIGATPRQRQHYAGAVDNVRIYARALSGRELANDRSSDVADDKTSGSGNRAPAPAPGAPGSPPPLGTPSGFPDSSTTGWKHTGVTLRTVKVGDSGAGWSAETVSGNPVFYIRTAGAVIDGLDIPMCVKVVADDVTIKRSRIACASDYTINTSDPPSHFQRLTLTDVEIDGLSSTEDPGIAVMATPGATMTRLDVHGFGSSGPRLEADNTLQDSYIHDFVCAPPDHSAGTTANDGGSNIRILRNNVDIATGSAGCASTAIGIDQDFGTYDGVLIQRNLVNGGAYCMYTAQNQGSTNVRVEGNHFGRRYYRNCGQFGPAAQVQSGNGNTFIGNVWDDTDQPVHALR